MLKYGIIIHKPALTFIDQLELLKSRGLIVENDANAIQVLNRVNYYKLSGYSLSMRINDKFVPMTTFNQIYRLYLFNKEFSLALFDLIESIEGTIKTQIAYYMAHQYGATGYLNAEHFRNANWHLNFMDLCERSIERNKRLGYVQHNLNTYGSLPVWVMLEILSFGEVSKLYGNMILKDQRCIAKGVFGVAPNKLKNWLEVITIIRNRCAHHGRLYNTYLSIPLNLYRDMRSQGVNSKSYYALLIIMKKLVLKEAQWSRFVDSLERLLINYADVLELNRLGFKGKWRDVLSL